MAWVTLVQRYALWVLLIVLALGAGMGYFTIGHLSLDTNTSNMISGKLLWRQAEMEVDRLFPKQSHTLAIVIDGDTPADAAAAQSALIRKLKSDPKLFPSVFALDNQPFFRRNGLLYLSLPKLKKLSNSLVEAQPFLGALSQDPSLHGLFTLLDQAIGQAQTQGIDLGPALTKISAGVSAASEDRPYQLSWASLMGAGKAQPDATRRFIDVKPAMDYSQMLPGGTAIDAVRADIADLHLDARNGVRVRLTGIVAMEHEELLSAASGAGIAFAVGLILVIILLFVALRSWRLVLAALVTLVYGLVVTAAFAAEFVGHLNLISVAFGVLYIGLGIDYALYLCMQFRERLGHGEGHSVALPHAASDIGGFMVVCALTTSIGFFAFIPTDFTGIAELGLISGVGMFISLVVSLTLLPAFLALLPPDPEKVRLTVPDRGLGGWLLRMPYRHGRLLWALAIIGGVGSLFIVPHAHFDYNPLDLRNPHSESVSTYRDLLKDRNIPTLTMTVLAPDKIAAQRMSAKLLKLPLVRRAMTIDDFIPSHQQAKLAIIQNLVFTLGPDLETPPQHLVANDHDDIEALRKLQQDLSQVPDGNPQAGPMHELSAQLDRFNRAYTALDAVGRKAVLKRLRHDLLGSLPQHLRQLAESLQAQPVTFKTLPRDLVRRWVAPDGQYRIQIWPKKILDNNKDTAAFVDQVRGLMPQASGGPVDSVESGRAVVKAFRHAFLYSAIAITILLLILLRNVLDTLLVLIPLSLAGLLTIAATVLAGMQFNFANVIALPLILGVGVDYGVFIVQRGRSAGDRNLLMTGSARAVLFGALITVANFGNLALSHHPGTRSMGELLTLGLGTTLVCALILLPSLIARRYGHSAHKIKHD